METSFKRAAATTPVEAQGFRPINILRQTIFWGVHLACLGVIWVGISPIAVAICVLMYVLRMFAITGGYHRYFAHRTYKTSRFFQFCLAFLGASSAQKGPLWWASHHRHHHQFSDQPEDLHSPRQQGLWWSHLGWILSTQYLEPRTELIRDFVKFPEIRFIDRWHMIPPVTMAVLIYLTGAYLQAAFPALNTSGTQLLIWGFFVSTTLLYHGTFMVNSLTHLFGRQRFYTGDDSRNSFLIALVTLGEGWHNNHHRYPGSEPQGFYWWEVDISHYILKALSWAGIVWDIRRPPERIYREAVEGRPEHDQPQQSPANGGEPANTDS